MENIEKNVGSVELTSEDGLLIWRKIYDDGTNGDWERTGISTADRNGLIRLKEELEEKYGQIN